MKKSMIQICMAVLIVISGVLFVSASTTGIVVSPNSAYYYAGGQYVQLDPTAGSRPIIQSGRLLIPIRPVSESLGVQVQWKADVQEIVLKDEGKEITLAIGAKTICKEEICEFMDVSPVIMNGRTYVPLRAPLEALGFAVKWHEDTKTAEVARRIDQFLDPDTLKNLNYPDVAILPEFKGMTLFPADNVWNTAIDQLPVHPQSAAFIQSIGEGDTVHPDFGTFWDGNPIGFQINVVPGNQASVSVNFEYDDESDPGPYPIPSNPLIEAGSDRHVLILQQGKNMLYELYAVQQGTGGQWNAGSGAIWNLNANEKRPNGWTSADAAGLAIFPGLVRYDEVYEKKAINHALRITLQNIRRAYISPATHSGGRSNDGNLPPMGLRMRLKADYDVSGYSPDMQVILTALKKYGVIVADIGSDMFISGLHDTRWDNSVLRQLKQLKAADFEAVYTGEAQPY